MTFNSIPELLEDIRAGRMVVILDDEDRENEGDLIMAATKVRPEDINFMVREARGLVCLALTGAHCRQLDLQPMVSDNTSRYQTHFTVSIEAAEGVTTGISAHDRAHTIQTAVAAGASPAHLSRPGHIFPLQAQSGGVLDRAGHTEATVDLAALAGLFPAGVLVEILAEDGSMARRAQLQAFAQKHALKIATVADLIRHRQKGAEHIEPMQPDAGSASPQSGKINPRSRTSRQIPEISGQQRSADGARYAIIASRWNAGVVDALIDGALTGLHGHNVKPACIDVLRVPGAWEIPVVAERVATSGSHAAIIALGCVIRGDTRHYENVADGCAQGLMDVSTRHGVPVLNGVLAVEQAGHAMARAGGRAGNKGEEVALAALEMAQLWTRSW